MSDLFGSDGRLSASGLRRVAAEAASARRHSVGSGLNGYVSAQGAVYVPEDVPAAAQAWVRLVGATPTLVNMADGGTLYANVAVTEQFVAGQWSVTDSGCWYWPQNGETPVGGIRYEARLIGTDTSGRNVWSAAQRGLTVSNTIGPFTTPCYNLQCDARNIVTFAGVVGSPNAYCFVIADATTGQAGVVNTTTQSFNGDKGFQGTVTSTALVVNTTASFGGAVTASDSITASGVITSNAYFVSAGNVYAAGGLYFGSADPGSLVAGISVTAAGMVFQHGGQAFSYGDNGGGPVILNIGGNAYAVRGAVGKDGTDAIGNSFTGGICTAIGGGGGITGTFGG